jgi:hypothetical protein
MCFEKLTWVLKEREREKKEKGKRKESDRDKEKKYPAANTTRDNLVTLKRSGYFWVYVSVLPHFIDALNPLKNLGCFSKEDEKEEVEGEKLVEKEVKEQKEKNETKKMKIKMREFEEEERVGDDLMKTEKLEDEIRKGEEVNNKTNEREKREEKCSKETSGSGLLALSSRLRDYFPPFDEDLTFSSYPIATSALMVSPPPLPRISSSSSLLFPPSLRPRVLSSVFYTSSHTADVMFNRQLRWTRHLTPQQLGVPCVLWPYLV